MSPTDAEPLFELSVIIPSHNRREALMGLLDALAGQRLSTGRFEVIIVLDGATDGSAASIAEWARKHPAVALRVIEQTNQGQSAARSRGAAEARGEFLLFLDDDVVPEPGCLAAHLLRHQQSREPIVVLGEARMVMREDESYYDLLTRMWWDETYAERLARRPYSNYRDFCAGHVSLPRDVFFEIGGFDPAFRGYGGEDFDLGYRLLRAGVRLVPDVDAAAIHHHRGSQRRVLRNLVSEGGNDVRLGRKHPELRRGLRLARHNLAVRIIFLAPWAFRASLPALSLALHACERLHLWRAWRRVIRKARMVAYWVGVARSFRGWRELVEYLDAAPPPSTTTLDTTDGLPADLSSVWTHGPSVITLRARCTEVGRVHLDAIPEGRLAEYLADRIVDAAVCSADRARTSCSR